MKKNSIREIKLTSVDDLFENAESREASQREKILEIPISIISDFPNHPFKIKTDTAMLEMADSIRSYGVIVPALVRPKSDGTYEMVSGHRRKKASEIAGNDVLPCLIRHLDDNAAIVAMVDSNLQRENILPSERAFAYRMKLEAMNRQGERSDLTCSQFGNKSEGKKSSEILADQVGESKNQIFRYIRLTYLLRPLISMVDEKKISLNPAVEISYLTEKEQQNLHDTMKSRDCTFSLAQAQKMRKLSQDGQLSIHVINSILTEEKVYSKEKLVLKRERVDRFFPKGYTEKQMEALVIQLLQEWSKKQINNK